MIDIVGQVVDFFEVDVFGLVVYFVDEGEIDVVDGFVFFEVVDQVQWCIVDVFDCWQV